MAELQSSAAAARARSTPRSLLQKRATMQLLVPLLQQSGYYTDSASMKTMSDIADAALLALWLQRARAAAVAAADHANFAAAYPAAAADISSALLHEVPQSTIRATFGSAAIYCTSDHRCTGLEGRCLKRRFGHRSRCAHSLESLTSR